MGLRVVLLYPGDDSPASPATLPQLSFSFLQEARSTMVLVYLDAECFGQKTTWSISQYLIFSTIYIPDFSYFPGDDEPASPPGP